MKKLPIGLVIEGNSTSSTLLRLSAMAAELGPIKASSLQVARRVSNFLKGGYGVSTYPELANSRTILIRVPDASIDRTVSEICNADLVWANHGFVLCESWAPTEKLDRLKDSGAGVVSMVALPTAHHKTFVLEGDLAVVRQMRRLIESAGVRSVELKPGSKHLLFAATLLCSAIPIPPLLMAQHLLRDSGVSGNQLSAIIEEMSIETLSGFLKGARMTWGGTLAESLKSTKGSFWDQLDATHPELSSICREMVELSRAYMLPTMSRGQGA